jgi:hypothetical protein
LRCAHSTHSFKATQGLELLGKLYRKQLVDGGYRLDKGAVLDDFFHFLQALGMMALLEQSQGAAMQWEMIVFVQDYPALWGEDPV